jgi:ribosome-associated toxin RatA of RatAB toxin-antitoxin module
LGADRASGGNLRPMAEQSTKSITIEAAPADIMAVVADFDAYPAWTGSVKKAEVLEVGPNGRALRVAFTLDAGVVKDDYELAYIWYDDQRVEWNLIRGQMQRAQHGSYTLVPAGAATEVTYALTVDLAIPMLGMLKRKAEKVIMDTALKELKKRVESAQ